jgi:serine/threonine-protein kinase
VIRAIARAEPVAPPVVLAPGTRVGPYEVGDVLGRGGMAVVYRAVDTRLGRKAALKILRASLAGQLRSGRMLREARSAAAASHPNVATVYEVGEANGLRYIAMELVEGTNLRNRLTAGALGLDEGRRLAREIALGLASAHRQGVVHRDLKPENVMLGHGGGVKIVDFGLAKLRAPLDDAQDTQTLEGTVMGTPGHMAPEQLAGKPTDARTDVYAFGIVMHELLTGTRPSLLGDGAAIADERLAAIVRRCVASAPEDRWANAGEIVDALDASPVRPDRPVRWRWWVTAGVLACGAVAASVLAAQRSAPDGAAPAPIARPPGMPFGALQPVTSNPQALAEYNGAMADLRDAVRNPQLGLLRAIALDPDFAAAQLRLAFATWQPSSTRAYREAARRRDRLDARDLELLAADEPLELSNPPDYAEGERRFRALLARRGDDPEVRVRLALLLTLEHEFDKARAEYAALEQLDPTIATAQSGLGDLLRRIDPDESERHYRTCMARWPMAAACLMGVARARGAHGECSAYFDLMKRVVVITPDDPLARRRLLESMLAAGSGEDAARAEVQMQVDLFGKLSPSLPVRADLERALRFGAFDDAQADLERLQSQLSARGISGLAFLTARLAVLEEIGDEAGAVAFLRRYVGYRAARAPLLFDAIAIAGLHRHRAMSDEAIAALRDRWRADSVESSPQAWESSIRYDAALASTPAHAQAALARIDLAKVPPVLDPELGLILGRVLLLAGRTEDARTRLQAAATTCLFTGGGDVETHALDRVRAALDLGRAREALHDAPGACAAYQSVIDRWGGARPRSATATTARDARRRLHCPAPPDGAR